jgi:hypothetical protein
MGSKKAMLRNGLGTSLQAELEKCNRFVDLFTGSGSVAMHVATGWKVPVLAVDLQRFAVALADAVIGRDEKCAEELIEQWICSAERSLEADVRYREACRIQKLCEADANAENVALARDFCGMADSGPISRSYGGHYFGPLQALALDKLRDQLPEDAASQKVALGGLVDVASMCAAAPGHTAQPSAFSERHGRRSQPSSHEAHAKLSIYGTRRK